MSKRLDLAGQKFGRLTVLEFAYVKNRNSYWKCICDCGNIYTVEGQHLKNGHTKSCGCIRHGKSNTRLHKIWTGMKDRCYNKNCKDYSRYGGRGILICDEWRNDFMKFYTWAIANGYSDELSIDRIDVDGNYEPSNCRWATLAKQNRNMRTNIKIEYQEKKMCLAEASRLSGISQYTLYGRYKRGLRGEDLFRPTEK